VLFVPKPSTNVNLSDRLLQAFYRGVNANADSQPHNEERSPKTSNFSARDW
jgi:hypothetical protein